MHRLILLTLVLSALSAHAAETNPVRGDAAAIALGAGVYQANCARCHGDQATRPSADAPDLRRLNSFCEQLKDTTLQARCLQDVDGYFMMSVNTGKVRAGIVYMPPWRDVLTAQEIWAVRSFVESRPAIAPRLKTSVDAQHEAH
jgi:mono/diheme cytochrome c family protein